LDDTSLVFLCQVVGHSGLTALLWSNEDQVELVFVLDSRWVFDFKLISSFFRELSLKAFFLLLELLFLVFNFLNGSEFLWLLILLLFVFLLLAFNSCGILVFLSLDLFKFLVQLVNLLVNLLDLVLEVVNASLLLILLFETPPELHAWLPQRQVNRLWRRQLEVLMPLQDFFFLNVLLVKVQRVNFDSLVHRILQFEALDG